MECLLELSSVCAAGADAAAKLRNAPKPSCRAWCKAVFKWSHLYNNWRRVLVPLTCKNFTAALKGAVGMGLSIMWVSESSPGDPSSWDGGSGKGFWVPLNFALVASLDGGLNGLTYQKAKDRIYGNAVALIFTLLVRDLLGVTNNCEFAPSGAVFLGRFAPFF